MYSRVQLEANSGSETKKKRIRTNARLFVAFVGVHEAHFALAAERSWIVEALAVFAQRRVVGALVDVLTHVAVAPEAGVAHALK